MNSMSTLEYVIFLSSLILGLGLTQILIGVSNMVTRKNIKLSLPQGLMTILVFLTMVQEWWITWEYSKTI